MSYKLACYLLSILLLLSAHASKPTDKNPLKEIKIGSQTWLAQNLDVSTFKNGDPIPEASTKEEWIKASIEKKPAWCYYNNEVANGKIFGKLYNGYAVLDKRGLAPEGWHVPTDDEWSTLIRELGGEQLTAQQITDASGNYWKIEAKSINNKTLFTALPAGFRQENTEFTSIGDGTAFWTYTVEYDDKGSVVYYYLDGKEIVKGSYTKDLGYSVRCVKN